MCQTCVRHVSDMCQACVRHVSDMWPHRGVSGLSLVCYKYVSDFSNIVHTTGTVETPGNVLVIGLVTHPSNEELNTDTAKRDQARIMSLRDKCFNVFSMNEDAAVYDSNFHVTAKMVHIGARTLTKLMKKKTCKQGNPLHLPRLRSLSVGVLLSFLDGERQGCCCTDRWFHQSVTICKSVG